MSLCEFEKRTATAENLERELPAGGSGESAKDCRSADFFFASDVIDKEKVLTLSKQLDQSILEYMKDKQDKNKNPVLADRDR